MQLGLLHILSTAWTWQTFSTAVAVKCCRRFLGISSGQSSGAKFLMNFIAAAEPLNRKQLN